MKSSVKVELHPLGRTISVARGTGLQDLLFAHGVEFPCGGRGRCKGCRIRVLAGQLSVSADDDRLLSSAEIAAGWRLACRGRVTGPLKLELAQWEATILADNTVFAFTPRDGLGIAVDVGTTTVVAQLLDLRTGHVLAVRAGLNAQARHGADIMSRIDFSLGGGQAALQKLIRQQIGLMLRQLLAAARVSAADLTQVVLAGNTVMHHLFSGLTVEPLSRHPFTPKDSGPQIFTPSELGWELDGQAEAAWRTRKMAQFLPCLGGFVGSDIVAGILATRLLESEALAALVDLGTNGEIVLGNRDGLLCASTAAGPAFEGARISMGMRAATGAVAQVTLRARQPECVVIGHVAPRGICGSGLVDAVSVGLELGRVLPSGRLVGGQPMCVAPPVSITQADIRQVQLAKAAIAAGIRLLLKHYGARAEDLTRIYLAGAFGNYINRLSAQRIGLLDFPPDKVCPAGNTALLGAKLALFRLGEDGNFLGQVLGKTRHVALNQDPDFQDVYIQEMPFPKQIPP